MERVCFLEYQANIYFSSNTYLQIEGAFEFVGPCGVPETMTGFPILNSRLPSLTGAVVREMEFDRATGDIRLRFEEGSALIVQGDSGPYESYRLSNGTEDIIV